MKRKIALGLCAGLLTLSLVGCSSSKEEKPAEETAAFTGEKTVETETYDKKGTVITTVDFKDGKPVDVQIDVKNEEGKLKSELSEAGEYEMPNAIAPWHEQVDTLETFLKENEFDTSKVTVSNEGKTDAVSGVSISVGDYLTGVNKALEEVK